METQLPQFVGLRDWPQLYRVCGEVMRSDDQEIILDCSRVKFIEPHGMAVLCALLEPLRDRRISMPWLERNYAGYLARMDFFKHCDVEDVDIPDWNRYERPDLVELTCVSSSIEVDEAALRLADAVTGRLTQADPKAEIDPNTGRNEYLRFRHPIWYSLSELLLNAVTHAHRHGHARSKVWVTAQYYSSRGEVKLSVVDNGCGILRTLQNHPELPQRTHLDAIRFALKPKISCNRESPYQEGHGNQGVGLTTTMRIARAARGRLTITSGNSHLETEQMRGWQLPLDGQWQGVAVAFSCRRSALPAVKVSQLLPEDTGGVAIPLHFG